MKPINILSKIIVILTFVGISTNVAHGKTATSGAAKQSEEVKQDLGISPKPRLDKVKVTLPAVDKPSLNNNTEEDLKCFAPTISNPAIPVTVIDEVFAEAGLPDARQAMKAAGEGALVGLVHASALANAASPSADPAFKKGMAKLNEIAQAAINKAIQKFGSFSTQVKEHLNFVWSEIRAAINAESAGLGDDIQKSCAI